MAQLEAVAALVPADFVLQCKARAEAARARHAALAQAPAPAYVAPKGPARDVKVEAQWLTLAKRFAVPDAVVEAQPVRAVVRRPQGLAGTPEQARADAPPRELEVRSGSFVQADDGVPADPTWLQFALAPIPGLARAGFRTATQNWRRGVWRAAAAKVLMQDRRHYQSVTGALIVAARHIAESGQDPRTRPGYCCAPGWGFAAYRLAGVEGLIHQPGVCRCGA